MRGSNVRDLEKYEDLLQNNNYSRMSGEILNQLSSGTIETLHIKVYL